MFDSDGRDGRNQILCNSFGCSFSVLTETNLQLYLASIVHALRSANSVWRDFMNRLSPKRCFLFNIYSQSLSLTLRKATVSVFLSCLSVRLSTWLPLDGLQWNFDFENFMKLCRENLNSGNIGQQYWGTLREFLILVPLLPAIWNR
jgi:hypothetical protein